MAQGLWERANTAANKDPVKAEQAFKRMLEEAAAHDATPAVGKETLVDAKTPADPASLGPGKLTRVLEEQKAPPATVKKDKAAPSSAGPAAPAPAGGDVTADAAKKTDKKTPDTLRTEIAAAVHAGQSAAALLAGADPATIVEALRELKATEGQGLIQKLMSVAGSAIERLLDARAPDAEAKAAEPVGDKVGIDTGEEKHTQFVDDAGVPMMASTPRPVTQRLDDWKRYLSEQPPAVQSRVAPEIARATQLTTTVADLTKKAKAGDAAAKTALATAQQQLAGSISAIGRQIPPEPEKKPAPPPTPAAPPPPPAAAPAVAKSTAPPVPGAPVAAPPKVSPSPTAPQVAGATPAGKTPPPATPTAPAAPAVPEKSDAEKQLEAFIDDELKPIRGMNFAAATRMTVTRLAGELGTFELGLQLHVGKLGSIPKVVEAKAFIAEKRSALEDRAQLVFTTTILTRTGSPKLDPATYRELEQLSKLEVDPWLAAFRKDAASFHAGLANCQQTKTDLESAQKLILKHHDQVLRAAITAISAVDPKNPGDHITTEIAKVQLWLDAILLPDPQLLRVKVAVERKLKEADIKKAAEAAAAAKVAEAEAAAKAAAAKPKADAKDAKPEAQPQKEPDKKAAPVGPAPPTPEAAKPEAKQLTDKEKAALQKEKVALELKLVEEQLELMMEKALKGYEIFNLGGALGLTAATLLAHVAPMIVIPAALGKAGIMFYTKYSKKKGYLQAKNQLLMLPPDQIRELGELFGTDLYSFSSALKEVDKAAKVAKFQTGAGEDTAKKEAAPLGVDAVEVGTALSGVHEGVVHLMHVGASLAGPIVAGIQLGMNFHEAAHASHKIHDIKKKLEQIDVVLGNPTPPAVAAPPPPSGGALVLPPLPPSLISPPPRPPPKVVAPVANVASPAASTAAPTKTDKPATPEKTAAEPIIEKTTMAGASHTLKADSATGKIEFNSIAGFAVEKLQSILDLVPPDIRGKVAAALAQATDAAATLLNPALKPGAEPAARPEVAKQLGDKLRALAIKIRIVGDSGKLTDAHPEVVQRARAEEEARLHRTAQPQPAAPASAVPTAAAPTAAAPTAAAPTAAAPTAAAPASAAPTAAAAAPTAAPTAAPAPAAPAPAAATSAAGPTPASPAPASAAPTAGAPASTAPAPVAATPAPVASAPVAPVAPTADAKAPTAPTHTAAESNAELAGVTSAPIEQGKGQPPVHFVPGGPLELKTDSPDPIRLKDKVITLTKAYLELDKRVPEVLPADRKAALGEIAQVFAELRVAMAKARGEDDKLVQLRVKFEKFLGEKATHSWAEGTTCVTTMAGHAKAMIAEVETGALVEAGNVDKELAKLSDAAKSVVAKKLGTDINVGFAGAVGKSFGAIIEALTTGSLVQKAQTLINFSEQYMANAVLAGSVHALARMKANIATLEQTDPGFQLDKRLKDAAGKDTKTAYKILCSSPQFVQKMDLIKTQNKDNDAKRESEGHINNQGKGEAFLFGDMDTKTPQQPVENLDEAQLDFLSQQGQPKVDLKQFSAIADPEARKQQKISALKAAGHTLSKAPGVKDEKGKTEGGGMVDATSINEHAVEATIAQITVENKFYIEGKAENIVDPKAQWIKDAVAAKMPLKAGISGTTARFVGAAGLLGGSRHGAAVAMIGHLQAIEAHSFWEIAEGAGLGMTPGVYTPFVPHPTGMTSAATEFVGHHATDIALGPTDAADKHKVLLGETKGK